MTKSEIKYSIIVALLLTSPIVAAFAAVIFFQNKYHEIDGELANQIEELATGTVAGAETKKVEDLTKELPILPNAEIISVDTSSQMVSVTLETTEPKEQAQTFYDDYLFLNGWERTDDGKYTKNNKLMSLSINENVIKITIEN